MTNPQQDMNALMQQVAQLTQVVGVLAANQQQAATQAPPEQALTSPEYEAKKQEAMAERQRSIADDAKPVSSQVATAFADFNPAVTMKLCNGMARQAVNGYMFSRRMAEYTQQRLDRVSAQGQMSSDPTAEIDEIRQAEEMLQIHVMNMEQNEVGVAVCYQWWEEIARECKGDEQLSKQLEKWLPDFDISEAAFANFQDDQAKRYNARRAKEQKATNQANRDLLLTERHWQR